MAADVESLRESVGELRADVRNLATTVRENNEATTREHRTVHDIVVATSESMRVLTARVEEMKPLTDDYREKRAEARGAAKFAIALWVTLGGLITVGVSKFSDWITMRPHP
jgi:hypothetical protein